MFHHYVETMVCEGVKHETNNVNETLYKYCIRTEPTNLTNFSDMSLY